MCDEGVEDKPIYMCMYSIARYRRIVTISRQNWLALNLVILRRDDAKHQELRIKVTTLMEGSRRCCY